MFKFKDSRYKNIFRFRILLLQKFWFRIFSYRIQIGPGSFNLKIGPAPLGTVVDWYLMLHLGIIIGRYCTCPEKMSSTLNRSLIFVVKQAQFKQIIMRKTR